MPDALITRARPIIFKKVSGRYVESSPQGYIYYSAALQGTIAGRQVTASEGHPFRKRKGKVKDLGGPFRTTKHHILFNGSTAVQEHDLRHVYGPYNNYSYKGPVFPVPTSPVKGEVYLDRFPPTLESTDQFLHGLGTTAIARCKPTNSIADLAVTLAELKREGLPSLVGAQLWKSRAKSLREKSRAAGGEYLNVQFGWSPLISDVNKAITAAQTADKVITQFRRDAGRVVRRRYKFPRELEVQDPVTQIIAGVGFGPNGAALNQRLGTSSNDAMSFALTKVRTIERNRWFSGAFTYYMPLGDTLDARIGRATSEARKLYGLSIDPSVIWNLLPWSWAIDWAVNVGDLLSNASDAMTDGLVMPYGYMMEHTIVTDTYTADLGVLGVGPTSMSFVTETKKRVKASPYGFGLTFDGFSPYQLSILAALGISRR